MGFQYAIVAGSQTAALGKLAVEFLNDDGKGDRIDADSPGATVALKPELCEVNEWCVPSPKIAKGRKEGRFCFPVFLFSCFPVVGCGVAWTMEMPSLFCRLSLVEKLGTSSPRVNPKIRYDLICNVAENE
jgi:hypothetical protein